MTKIYLIENIDNNFNKVYIGKTKNNRELGHKNTYGHQIIYTYIDEIDSLNHKDWEPLETYWIEQFRQWGFDVVNKRKKGGSGPISHAEETRQKISLNKTGHECYFNQERNNKISMALQNHSKHYTEEIINKMKKPKPLGFGDKISKATKGVSKPFLKGRISPNKGNNIPHLKTRKPIIQYNKQGEFIKEWDSATEASLYLNVSISQISAVARGNTKWKTAGGFKWKQKYE